MMAAAGTRAGAEKARATKAARSGEARAQGGPAPGGVAQKGHAVGTVGTARIAPPVDLAATEALKSRRDKAAARERLGKLPDHGRHVAPQGLNRLPKGFAVGNSVRAKAGGKDEHEQSVGAQTLGLGGEGRSINAGQGPVVKGTVTLELGVFLTLAERAGLDLAAVAEMTRAGGAVSAQAVGLSVRTGTSGLSPIAMKALRAREVSGGLRRESQEAVEPKGEPHSWAEVARGEGRCGSRSSSAEEPESSRMAEERAARARMGVGGFAETERVVTDEQLARKIAQQEEYGARRAQEEQLLATSRDAELAMELVAREAQEKGVDRAAALAAQGMGEDKGTPREEKVEAVAGKGKQKVAEKSSMQADLERGLAWERRLGAGQWRGAQQVAAVTLQTEGKEENKQLMEDAHAHTRAMACFAEGRPKVSPSERGGVEGSPDWVNNEARVVQVATPHGLVAPRRVLIDGGSFYSMAGAKLKAQLGLQPGDMDAAGLRVHTATGKIDQSPLCSMRGRPKS